MRQRGVSLLELMIALALISVLAAVCGTLAASARGSGRLGRAYAEDLRHLRRASDTLAAAVRGARRIALDGETLRIDGVAWSVEGGVLRRDGEAVVRGGSRMNVELAGDGFVRVGVAPVPRRAGAAAPALVTLARPRSAEVPR